jgi:hypothetical protein
LGGKHVLSFQISHESRRLMEEKSLRLGMKDHHSEMGCIAQASVSRKLSPSKLFIMPQNLLVKEEWTRRYGGQWIPGALANGTRTTI